MDCEKVRDRFSSLLEGELNPLEEEVVRGHLASCEECKKEWERFGQMFRWLHSVEEVEVPEGFLPGIYKKMEERKKKPIWKGFQPPLLKIPVQAVAMVAIVFLALYLTKMTPVETPHREDVKQLKGTYSDAKKEIDKVQKEVRKERVATRPPLETSRLKGIGEGKAPFTEEKGRVGAYVKEEEKKMGEPSPKTEMAAVEIPHPKEMGKVKVPLVEERKIEKELVKKEKISLAAKSPQEVTLKISDREKTLTQLHELIKKFGGEIVMTTEENVLLASLPVSSYLEFEKGLVELGSPKKAEKLILQKDAEESLSIASGAKRREVEGKGKGLARPMIDKEGYIAVRILLVEE